MGKKNNYVYDEEWLLLFAVTRELLFSRKRKRCMEGYNEMQNIMINMIESMIYIDIII